MQQVTFCLLTYGPYTRLVRRAIESIRRCCPRSLYTLVVGANQPSANTTKYLEGLKQKGAIDRLEISPANLNKNPMMRRMLRGIQTPFVWWLDDDSYFRRVGVVEACLRRARASPASVAIWGQVAVCHSPRQFTDLPDVAHFIRTASWYGGLTPPSWNPGGKGELNFEGKGTGDGRWFFVLGASWLMRTECLRALDWPDRRLLKNGEDVLLGEAIRQQGWTARNVGSAGVAINMEKRRGDPGYTPWVRPVRRTKQLAARGRWCG